MLHRRTFLGLGASAALGGLTAAAQIKPPKKASELVIALNSGEQLLLSKFQGKIVVIEFLLTTCPHCATCTTTMQKVQTEMGGEKAFTALGAAVNPNSMMEARMMIPEYVARTGAKFPIGWTQREMAYNWLEASGNGPVYFPQLAIIDRAGVVRMFHPGTDEAFFKNEAENLKREVASLINARAVPVATKK